MDCHLCLTLVRGETRWETPKVDTQECAWERRKTQDQPTTKENNAQAQPCPRRTRINEAGDAFRGSLHSITRGNSESTACRLLGSAARSSRQTLGDDAQFPDSHPTAASSSTSLFFTMCSMRCGPHANVGGSDSQIAASWCTRIKSMEISQYSRKV